MVTQISGQTTHLVVGLEPGAKKVSDADKQRTPKIDLKDLRTLLDTIKRQALVDLARPSTVPAAAASAAVSAIMNAAVPAAAASAVTVQQQEALETARAIALVAADPDPTLANMTKHFAFFLKRIWTVVEAGMGGNCFFHSVLLMNRIHKHSSRMPRTHAALRNQVISHMRDHADTLVVCEQPISSLLDARAPSFLANMKREGTYVEYEVIGGFAHFINEAVIVYSQQCRMPLVIYVSCFYM